VSFTFIHLTDHHLGDTEHTSIGTPTERWPIGTMEDLSTMTASPPRVELPPGR
jgi:hypothetical protein